MGERKHFWHNVENPNVVDHSRFRSFHKRSTFGVSTKYSQKKNMLTFPQKIYFILAFLVFTTVDAKGQEAQIPNFPLHRRNSISLFYRVLEIFLTPCKIVLCNISRKGIFGIFFAS